MKTFKYSTLFILIPVLSLIGFQSCSTFTYKTYEEQKDTEDPEPNYGLTLNPDFQEYTSYMFIGNRVENFGTYFNTFFNAKENYEEAYEDYETRVLSTYSERLDSIYATPNLSQEAKDKFNKSIEKASKVIQYHKSSAFMDQAVLLIGKCYFYLGDYVKAERKFSEFVSKLSKSPFIDEALLFLARTQLRLGTDERALATLNSLIQNPKDKHIVAEAYQSLGEYYINKKDYNSSIKNYKKSIEFSDDNEFKAQMQFLIASVTARQNPGMGAAEFMKVLSYNTSYELEYLARFNHVKNLILSGRFTGVLKLLDEMRVDYKENTESLSDIDYLAAKYYEQKKDYKKAVKSYKEVIINYPKTVASSDASYSIANYYENSAGDYLTAFKYYKFSNEENINGGNAGITNKKIAVFKRYFELRSIIADKEINTQYDTVFLRELKPEFKESEENKGEIKNKGKGEEGPGGKPGGIRAEFNFLSDSSKTTSLEDSLKLKAENIAKAKFELAELFIYDIAKPDSAEKYLVQAYEESENYDFKSNVLFALAVLYKNNGNAAKYEEILRTIVEKYSLSPVANECRKLLNLPLVIESNESSEDSIFSFAENKFVNREYGEALGGFMEICSNYPSSQYYVKSNYAAGWIYENVFQKPDSAVFFYTKVIEGDPSSVFFNIVVDKLSEYQNSLNPKSDSLTDSNKIITPEEIKIPEEEKLKDNTKIEGEDNGLPNKNLDIKKEEDDGGEIPLKK